MEIELPLITFVMWKILMFEISAKNGLNVSDVILGSEEKLQIWQCTFHAILALQIRFCLGTFQTPNEHSRMAKLNQPYL